MTGRDVQQLQGPGTRSGLVLHPAGCIALPTADEARDVFEAGIVVEEFTARTARP